MPMIRSAALALAPLLWACGPAPAATCNMTVLGTSVLDDAACTVATARGVTRISVGTGATLLIRRSVLRARLPEVEGPAGRPARLVSYGRVVTSGADESDDKTCYFNQKAVLCVE